jgi:lipooligosaccharide transport system ATP-binding protein
VLTTHFMDEAERLCDRLAILDHGRVVAEGAPRALIESHIEPAVVEVFGEGLADWTRDHAAGLCQRFGETLSLHAKRCSATYRQRVPTHRDRCAEARKDTPALRYLHRPSNLEDVFLKLTGRDLRD